MALSAILLALVVWIQGPPPTFAQWVQTHAYLADEVDFNVPGHGGLTPAQLHAEYSAQTTHPQWVSFVNCRDALAYRGSFDGLMADDYPFYRNWPSADSLREWRHSVAVCIRVAHRLHVPLVMIAQGFGGVRDGPMSWRCPTAAEWAAMLQSPPPLIRFTIPGHTC